MKKWGGGTNMVETENANLDWHSWGTTDDEGNFLTFSELATRRRDETVHLISHQLGETNTRTKALIRDILRKIGTTATMEVYEDTLKVEQNGGMMLPSGSRRRTPGGVFFTLVKTRYPDARGLFRRYDDRPKKAKGPAQTPKKKEAVVVERKAKGEKQQKEKGTTVKIQIFGRPTSRVVDQGTFVVMIFQSTKIPAFPKGMPAPAETKTNYIVSVATKQWKLVAAALDDPEDQFIVEGFPQVDAKTGGIAVYATSITTKAQQKAKYAKPASGEPTAPLSG